MRYTSTIQENVKNNPLKYLFIWVKKQDKTILTRNQTWAKVSFSGI